MLNPRSFSEIYDELLIDETPSVTELSAGWESHLEPLGMAQLMAGLNLQTPRKAKSHKAYPSKPAPIAPAHAMTADEANAFEMLKLYHVMLQNNFTMNQLKSAYRQAVLKTHPDHGGSSESFQNVKKSYHILAALVKK